MFDTSIEHNIFLLSIDRIVLFVSNFNDLMEKKSIPRLDWTSSVFNSSIIVNAGSESYYHFHTHLWAKQ